MSTGDLSGEAEASTAKDRWFDRIMARLGKLDDADAMFSPGKNVPWAGVMIGIRGIRGQPLN